MPTAAPRFSRWTVVAAVLPPLIIGIAGMTHPAHLTQDAALYWRNLHIALLPLIPLLALGPWLVSRAIDRTYAWIALGLGYVYACFYSALDLLAGVGAGALKHAHQGGLNVVFGLATDLGRVGSIAFIAATTVAAVAVIHVAGARAIPGSAFVLTGAFGYWQNHVYWPGGVLSMFALAIGWALLLLSLRPAADA